MRRKLATKMLRKWRAEVKHDLSKYSRMQLLEALAPEAGKKAVRTASKATGSKKKAEVDWATEAGKRECLRDSSATL